MDGTTVAAVAPFREGELVEWVEPGRLPAQRKPSAGVANTIRLVRFEAPIDNEQARVVFGGEALTAPLNELRRPAPAPLALKTPAYTQPDRVALAAVRQRLLQALDNARQANAAMSAAAAAADRASTTLADARAELARFADHDRAAADRLVDALRSGTPDASHGPDNPADREAARRRCDAAERAAAKLTAELAEARAAATDADQRVRAAVRAVVVGIAEREGDLLIRLEAEVANCRAALRALAGYRPLVPGSMPTEIALPAHVLGLLTPTPPPGYATEAPWRDLYERLAAGDADADLNETPPWSTAG